MADTVVITGASRGIGLATAKLLAARNFTVIGIARSVADDFPGEFFVADLGDELETARVLEQIVQRHTVDCVINNVGLNTIEPLGSVALDNLRRVLDLNLRTMVQVTQAFLPAMISRKYGRIVNLSSRGALGREGRTSYGAAKAGVIGLTRTWALELAQHGITANVVSPGPTATEMFIRNNLVGPKGEENKARFLADIPMRRFGEPAEIAAAIAFFVSREASFVTGQVLHVCGGSSIGIAAL